MGAPRTDDDSTIDLRAPEADAYIPVRVTEEPRHDGRVLVYLPDGTGLVVNRRCLVPRRAP
jgi:hypothetical protein